MDQTALDVLVVDDDEIIRDSVADALEAEGHRVTRVHDGEAALTSIAKQPFDVVVSDVRMPKIDGMTLFRRLRRETPNTAVILMTSFGKISDAVGSLRDGAVDYVTKPFDPQEFARDVEGPIAERRTLRRRFEEARAGLVSREVGTSMIGTSLPMRQLDERLRRIAHSDAPVLLLGERGTGKKLAARMIHFQSARRLGPLVLMPCASLYEVMRESEMRELAEMRSRRHRDSWFHAAEGGTLILDGLDTLPLTAQANLLRIIQEPTTQARRSREWQPLGVRVIAVVRDTFPDLVGQGRFLEPLFFRLNAVQQHLPPLRERSGDLYALATHFLRELSPPGASAPTLTPGAWKILMAYGFPGNVRELACTLEHALVVADGGTIDVWHLPSDLTGRPKE